MKNRTFSFFRYILSMILIMNSIQCTKKEDSGTYQEVLFLHHSTGEGVFNEGKVASWIDSYNKTAGIPIRVTSRTYPEHPWPWSNYPYDYWKLWIGGSCDSANPNVECMNTLTDKYEMIILKHCFPGASIEADDLMPPDVSSSVKTIPNYKLQYRALRDLMDSYPDTKFMVWTLAPLHRLATSTYKADRAYEFVQWVNKEWLTEDGKLHPNIIIFDFYSLVAELNENPANGVRYCLKYDFEKSHSDDNSHPNTAANKYVGQLFAQAIERALGGE